jgi:predicted amidohydrolase YtcJ
MHLYDRALLNAAALRAVGYGKNAPDFPAGEIQRDRHGNPTGLLIANPNANILYSTLAKGPKLSREDQLNSSRLFFRELNRFGITSAIDAGGGFQNYPDVTFAKSLFLNFRKLKGVQPVWRKLFGLGLQADSSTGQRCSQKT